MSIEIGVFISVISVGFGLFVGIINMKRNIMTDSKSEAAQLTTVIVKLENINNGISEIKAEIKNIKTETKENREKLIRLEESVKSAHKRLDKLEDFTDIKGVKGVEKYGKKEEN